MHQPYPIGSIDHLYHQLVVAARHFEEVGDEINWGPLSAPFIRLPLAHDVQHWEQWEAEYGKALEKKLEVSREKLAEIRREFHDAKERFQAAIRDWQDTHRLVLAQFAAAAA